MAETSTIFGFMKYVSATDILSDFKKTVDSYFVNSLERSELIASFFCGCVFLIHVFYLLINVENQLFQLQSHSLDIPCHPSGIYANEYDH